MKGRPADWTSVVGARKHACKAFIVSSRHPSCLKMAQDEVAHINRWMERRTMDDLPNELPDSWFMAVVVWANAPHRLADPWGTCDSPDAYCIIDPNGDYSDCSWWNAVCHVEHALASGLAFAIQPALTEGVNKALEATHKTKIPGWVFMCMIEGAVGIFIVLRVATALGEEYVWPAAIIASISVLVGCLVAFVSSAVSE